MKTQHVGCGRQHGLFGLIEIVMAVAVIGLPGAVAFRCTTAAICYRAG